MELKMYDKYFIIRSQRSDLHKMCAYGCIKIHSDVELLNLCFLRMQAILFLSKSRDEIDQIIYGKKNPQRTSSSA